MMCHWVKQIPRYGTLQQYSSARHEQALKTYLQDGWNTSHHNHHFLPQVITFEHRILSFKTRKLNLKALARCQDISAAACKVLQSGAVLASPMSPQFYAKPEIVGPQNHADGNHSDGMIKDFRGLLDHTQDATHRVEIDSRTREFMKHKSRNKTYISDDQLHTMEYCMYHCIQYQVEGLEGKRTSWMCRCTGSQSCRGVHR